MGSSVSVDDKIQFVAPEATLADDGREHPHDTDINRVVAPNESVVAEILTRRSKVNARSESKRKKVNSERLGSR